MFKRFLKILFSFSFLISLNVNADQSLSTKIYDQYSSYRALGMGNAFTAVADDYSLIFYNPAGFARKKNNEIQFTLAGVGFSPKTTKLVKDIKDASDSATTDVAKANAISNVLDQYYGETLGGRASALEIFWTRKNWGFAILPADLTIDMSINRQLGPALDLNVRGDTDVAFGFGADINKNWAWGLTVKGIHRVAVEQSVSALELATNSDVLSSKRFKEGISVDADLGLMWTPSWFGKKTKIKNVIAKKTVRKNPNRKIASDTTIEKSTLPAATSDSATTNANSTAKPTVSSAATTPEVIQSTEAVQATTTDNPNALKAKGPREPLDPPPDNLLMENKNQVEALDNTKNTTLNTKDVVQDPNSKGTVEVNPDQKKELKIDQKPDDKAEVVDSKIKESTDEKQQVDIKEAVSEQNPPEEVESFPLTFGMVVRNALGGSFKKTNSINKDAIEAPTQNYRVIDIGSQYELLQAGGLTIRSMIDFRNMLHPEITFNKSFHAGLEFDFSPSGWFKTQLRAGVNQMYYTAGVTLLLGFINIDAVTYGEEVGTVSQKMENRVYAAKVGFNF